MMVIPMTAVLTCDDGMVMVFINVMLMARIKITSTQFVAMVSQVQGS